jgi:SAM-dependent methyltransferase
MVQPRDPGPLGPQTAPRARYIYRANPSVASAQGSRTATTEAAFFLPYLRPGIRLLDAGCGGGSITVGLGTVIAPGFVVGLDLEVQRLTEVRGRAGAAGVPVQLTAGDGERLPFADASFDAVFAHHVLQHLPAPARALREFWRVLRPGGVVGICDLDEGATLYAPATPLLDRARALELRLRRHYGSDPFYARTLRGRLVEAGFSGARMGATTQAWGTPALAQQAAAGWRARLAGPAGGDALVALGWVTAAELAAMEAAILAWGEQPGAFCALTDCAAVAWRP